MATGRLDRAPHDGGLGEAGGTSGHYRGASIKICLVTPPSCFLLDERVFPSLGILKVGAALEAAGYAVEHLDLSGVANYAEVAAAHAARTDARVFAFTATTPQMPAAVEVARAIMHSTRRLILGGPHVTLVNAAYKKEHKCRHGDVGRATKALFTLTGLFDVLVFGDGERGILAALKQSHQWFTVDADDPKSSLFMTNEELEAAPLPARHLIDAASYHYTIDGEPAMHMIAQLGCPFNCGFCGGRSSPMLRRVRSRSTESVLAEMWHLHEVYGVKALMLYDDELNVSKDVVQLMDGIYELGRELGFQWKLRGFVKAELFTHEQAEAMARAGFRWLLVGFESGSPRILENINKKAAREDNSYCLHTARAYGIKVKALMSLGHPGESEATVLETRHWLLTERPDDFDVTVITCYPGAPYYDDAVESSPGVWTYTARNGDRLHAEDVDFTKTAEYYKGVPGEYRSFVWTDYLTAEQIVSCRDALEADVRDALGVPFNAAQPGQRYEASMGQLPGHVLRGS